MAKRDKYNPDYKKLYPDTELKPEVLEHLKRSDRKMKYMEIDIKRGTFRQDTAQFTPSREDSLDRITEEENMEFPSYEETPEDIAVHNDEIDRLCMALKKLQPEEYELIHAVFFENDSEESLANRTGVTQQAISKRLRKIYKKIKILMKS